MNRIITTIFKTASTLLSLLIAEKSSSQIVTPIAYPSGAVVNYVRTWDAKAPQTEASKILVTASIDSFIMTTQYMDGLGRPVQTVIKQITPSGKDMVTSSVYDEFGREQFKYLPFAANNTGGNASISDGLFKLNPFQQQAAFYDNSNGLSPIKGQGETYFYSKTAFEPSPLNRVTNAYAPGNSWVGNSVGVGQQYLINTASDSVRIWLAGSNPSDVPTTSATYNAGQLYKNVTNDEISKQVIEYKDKEGKVILKKVQLSNNPGTAHMGWVCTYYVYDDFGNLRFVLQPKAVESILGSWNISPTVRDELCFYYGYDSRNRMTTKKVPGSGEVYMIYDARDRLVYTQDAGMRGRNWWLTTVYDWLNRPVLTAMMTYIGTRASLENFAADPANLNAPSTILVQGSNMASSLSFSTREPGRTLYQASTSIEFTNGFESEIAAEFTAKIDPTTTSSSTTIASNSNPFPSGATYRALTITNYDTYTATAKIYSTLNNSKLSNSSNFFPEPIQSANTAMTKGFVTSTKVWLMESNDLTAGRWLETTTFYNDRGRVIEVQSDNAAEGKDTVTSLYDFSGKVLCTYQSHNNPQSTSGITRVRTSMQYDALGRVLSVQKQINDAGANKTIVLNEYDALGQLKQKTLGASLETIKYDYNIRGWLLGANRSDLAGNGSSNSKFAFDLGYDKQINNSGQNYSVAQFNGNISGMIWKSAGDGVRRKYDFSYDAANRLMQGAFTQNNNGSIWNSDEMNYSIKMGDGTNTSTAYDANGNILAMKQWGWKLSNLLIDDLSYSYFPNSNQLLKVTDGVQQDNHLGDFIDREEPVFGQDYEYDYNGNLIKDINKDIQYDGGIAGSIIYNHLNLPTEIGIADGRKMIYYTYDAAGNKLQKKTVELLSPDKGSITTTTNYISGFIYESKSTLPDGPANPDYSNRLLFFGHEEGRIRPLTDGNNNITSFAYDYFLKDHLGNVRMVLTDEQKQDKYPVASLETAKVATEQGFYSINTNQVVDASIANGLSSYTNDNGIGNNPSDPGFEQTNSQKLYKLNSNSAKMGLGITLKVMAGDRIDVWGKSYYNQNNTGGRNANSAVPVLDILEGLLAGSAISSTHQGITAAQLNGLPTTTQGINGLLGNETSDNNLSDQVPKAYINYLFFDDQFKCVGSGFSKVGSNGALKDHHSELTNLAAQKNGYVYIYCSNESPVNVFFDNLQVVHTRGAILEETHYYPFGLAMNGISSKAAGSQVNNIKYNGKEEQQQEFSDGTGLETYDYGSRMQDPQIGRWWQIDPMAGKYFSSTPYNYVDGNPIVRNDLDGEDWFRDEKTGTIEWRPISGKQGEQVSIKGSKDTWTNLGAELLRFDGDEISYYTQETDPNGKLTLFSTTLNAVSGQPLTKDPLDMYPNLTKMGDPPVFEFSYSKDRQKQKNQGPTPEGLYSINKSDFKEVNNESGTQKWSEQSWINKLKSKIGGGTWPGGTDSWGEYRWQLHTENANTYGRSSMYLHGGTKWGSRGCIDTGNNIGTLANAILTNKTGNDKVYLQVVYPHDLMIKVANGSTNKLQKIQ
jgi:RHS repeat-associated protein